MTSNIYTYTPQAVSETMTRDELRNRWDELHYAMLDAPGYAPWMREAGVEMGAIKNELNRRAWLKIKEELAELPRKNEPPASPIELIEDFEWAFDVAPEHKRAGRKWLWLMIGGSMFLSAAIVYNIGMIVVELFK